MQTCVYIDFSEFVITPKTIIDFSAVTLHNVQTFKAAVPGDQAPEIEAGDEISVYLIEGEESSSSKRLTLWYNKEIAALESTEGSIWGDWDEDEALLLTEEFEEAQDASGRAICGRLAYNLLGLRGIHSGGRFYVLTRTRKSS